MSDFRFHENVFTPNGPGVVQGWLSKRAANGEYVRDRVIVSLKADAIVPEDVKLSLNSTPGIWRLAAYDPSLLQTIR